jgi:hypothetical protein
VHLRGLGIRVKRVPQGPFPLIAVVLPAHAGKAAVMLNGLDTYVPYNISLYEYSFFYRMLSIFYFFDMYVLKGNHLVFNRLVRLCVKLLQT